MTLLFNVGIDSDFDCFQHDTFLYHICGSYNNEHIQRKQGIYSPRHPPARWQSLKVVGLQAGGILSSKILGLKPLLRRTPLLFNFNLSQNTAVLKKVRYALCPMPYALCPIVPHMRARKARYAKM
jgi:hypothetical protein